jgi:hypothetical protein
VDRRRFWPIVDPSQRGTGPQGSRQIAFLETANQEGFKAYLDEGGVLGAVASTGLQAELIPRGGLDGELRRYWEVLLIWDSSKAASFFVDGFENAAKAMLVWLRGNGESEARSYIREQIVRKPGERGWGREAGP